MAGNHFAVDAAGFLGKPFDEAGTVDDLAGRFGERLALFQGEDAAEIVLVLDHQLEPAAQDAGALLGGAGCPFLLGDAGFLDCGLGLGCTELRHAADDLAGRRIVDFDAVAGVGFDPGTADQGGLPEESRVFQVHVRILQQLQANFFAISVITSKAISASSPVISN